MGYKINHIINDIMTNLEKNRWYHISMCVKRDEVGNEYIDTLVVRGQKNKKTKK